MKKVIALTILLGVNLYSQLASNLSIVRIYNEGHAEFTLKSITKINTKILPEYIKNEVNIKDYTVPPKYLITQITKGSIALYFFNGYPAQVVKKDLHSKALEIVKEKLEKAGTR